MNVAWTLQHAQALATPTAKAVVGDAPSLCMRQFPCHVHLQASRLYFGMFFLHSLRCSALFILSLCCQRLAQFLHFLLVPQVQILLHLYGQALLVGHCKELKNCLVLKYLGLSKVCHYQISRRLCLRPNRNLLSFSDFYPCSNVGHFNTNGNFSMTSTSTSSSGASTADCSFPCCTGTLALHFGIVHGLY